MATKEFVPACDHVQLSIPGERAALRAEHLITIRKMIPDIEKLKTKMKRKKPAEAAPRTAGTAGAAGTGTAGGDTGTTTRGAGGKIASLTKLDAPTWNGKASTY